MRTYMIFFLWVILHFHVGAYTVESVIADIENINDIYAATIQVRSMTEINRKDERCLLTTQHDKKKLDDADEVTKY